MAKKKNNTPTTPEMEEKRKVRQRRARRRALWRGLVLVCLCVALFLLWQNWDVLAPDRLLDNLQDALGSGTGSFPVDVSGTGAKQLARSQDYLVAAVSKSSESLTVFAIPSLKRRLVISTAEIPNFSESSLIGVISLVITAFSILM